MMQSSLRRVVEAIREAPNSNPRRVMVGTDRSDTAERAVRWAASFADRFGADLHVVQVIVPERPGSMPSKAAEPIQAAADDLLQHARSIAGDRGGARINAHNHPARAIVRATEDG